MNGRARLLAVAPLRNLCASATSRDDEDGMVPHMLIGARGRRGFQASIHKAPPTLAHSLAPPLYFPFASLPLCECVIFSSLFLSVFYYLHKYVYHPAPDPHIRLPQSALHPSALVVGLTIYFRSGNAGVRCESVGIDSKPTMQRVS